MSRRLRLTLFAISILTGLVYIYISVLVHQDFFRSVDYATMVWVQNFFNRALDYPFSLLTLIGSSEIILILISLTFAYIFLRLKRIFLGIYFFVVIFLIEIIGKIIIYHPKPPTIFHRYALEFSFPSSYIIHTDFSYPSGHMARIAFLSTLFFYLILFAGKKKFSRMIFLAAPVFLVAVTFVSRIYLGHHWMSDVIGGTILGIGLASLSVSFW